MWKVTTFDVWGHGSHDCIHYGCPCVRGDNPVHDANRCDCDYTINDVFSAGELHPDVPLESTAQQLWEALIDAGFANRAPFFKVDFDDWGDGELNVLDAATRKPVFGLRWEGDE